MVTQGSPLGVATVLIAIAAPACTRVSDQSRFDRPDETIEILSSTPQPGELDVDPQVRVDLCLSGRLDPRSVAETDATFSSGTAQLDAGLAVQLVPWLEPGEYAAPTDTSAPWCPGSVLSLTPRSPLSAGAHYRLRLAPTAVGWAGEALGTEGPLWVSRDDDSEPRYFLEFTVDPEPFFEPPVPGEDPPVPPLTLTDLFSPGGPFDPDRALCSCHLDSESLAFARLDLRDASVAYEGLLGDSRLRDTGFPMVAARDASGSFLVHKLVRDPDGHQLDGIYGDAMPPEEPLAYLDLLRIVQWIEDGAEP